MPVEFALTVDGFSRIPSVFEIFVDPGFPLYTSPVPTFCVTRSPPGFLEFEPVPIPPVLLSFTRSLGLFAALLYLSDPL
jgi:hypothetical protein